MSNVKHQMTNESYNQKNIKRFGIGILFGFWILSFGFAGTVQAFSINLDPPSVHLSVAPGNSKSGTLRVTNNGAETISVAAYAEDWEYASDGSKTFKPAGSSKFSCSRWVNIFPTQFDLLPGQEKDVAYTLTVPGKAKSGAVSVIFFESTVAAGKKTGQGRVVFTGRIGSILFVEVEGKSVRKGYISGYNLTRPDENKPLEIEVYFKNTGSSHLSCDGSLAILDSSGNVYGREALSRINTLPGEERKGKGKFLGKLNPGQYTLLVTLDYGGDEPAVLEKTIQIVKSGSIKMLNLKRIAKNQVRGFVQYVNSGNTTLKIKGKFEISNSDGEVVKSFAIPEKIVLPNSPANFSFNWQDNIPAGVYNAGVTITYDAGKEQKEKDFKL